MAVCSGRTARGSSVCKRSSRSHRPPQDAGDEKWVDQVQYRAEAPLHEVTTRASMLVRGRMMAFLSGS